MKGETYEEFTSKFEISKARTTDECYTPKEVWEIIEEYVWNKYKVSKEEIIRPFYPGGDYKKEDYSSGVVVDNPPFSIMSEIVQFYKDNNIKFFLFCDGKCFSRFIEEGLCVILLHDNIIYENGAKILTCFLTNLESESAIRPDFELTEKIEKLNGTKRRRKRQHEEHCYSGAQFYTLCYDNNISFKHDELEYMRSDKYGKLFGGGFRVKKEGF